MGLIGFGSWVREAYLPALQYDGRAIVTAVTAATERTRRYAQEVLGDSVAVYDSYEDLLSQAKLDAVMIAVPDEAHQATLSAAIDSGIAVFYEPPISHLREQIPSMINHLVSAPQITFAHLELCFHPGIARIVQLVETGVIGLLQNVTVTLHANWGTTKNSDLCLMNRMSCWYVDVLNRIIGSVPKRVLVLDGYGGSGRMQAVSTGIYDYHGIWGVFRANVSSPEGVSITIDTVGSEGDICLDYFSGTLRYRSLLHTNWTTEHSSPLEPFADWPGVRETVSSFLDSVIRRESSLGNAENVAQLNLVGLAADRSKDTGCWENVESVRRP